MNLIKTTALFITLAGATLVLSKNAFAQDNSQTFTSCLTPTGQVIANYTDGNHGIPGLGSKIGKDAVYALGNGNAMQCFCGTDGAGTQTNWKKISDLSEDEVKIHENQGWIYVPDGSAWGLDEGSYLAQNISYSCGGSSITQSSRGDGLSDGLTDGRSDGRGSIVQSARGSNLASTGNILFVLAFLVTGVFLIVTGLFLRKNAK